MHFSVTFPSSFGYRQSMHCSNKTGCLLSFVVMLWKFHASVEMTPLILFLIFWMAEKRERREKDDLKTVHICAWKNVAGPWQINCFLFCISVQKHSYLFVQYSDTNFPFLLMTFCQHLQNMTLGFHFYFNLDLEIIYMK